MADQYGNLNDLIEPDQLFQLQRQISLSSDVLAVILDHNGVPVTSLTELNDLCRVRDETLGESCGKIHTGLFQRAKQSRGPELDICPNSGLSAAALPIYLQENLVCVWIICQFYYSEDMSQPPPEDLSAHVPVLNSSALQLLFHFITILTDDVLKLKRYNLKIKHMEENANRLAYHDRLMGLPNYLSLERDLQDGRYRNLIILDIADLRKINDVYGRQCGDLLLMAVRQYIEDLNITGSRLYRLDAADFGILLESSDKNLPRDITAKLADRFEHPWRIRFGGQRQNIFISVNVGLLPVDGDSDTVHHDLSSAIEHTLDVARRIGGIALFDDKENRTFRNRQKLALSLRHCVRDNMQGFSLVYQPIVDPGVAVWRGVEALCRWESPEFGTVPPGEFIHIAETSGLIAIIGEWVLEQAVSQVKAWGLDLVENFVLDVNLSPVQLLDHSLDQKILQILQYYQYPPQKLCLEITESNELNFSKYSLRVIKSLHKQGVVIALDDFGAGYASFNSLHKLPVTLLKTDRSLINGVEHDHFLKRLFYVMVEMAHASDMKIVAEGVETDSQAQLLLKEGADYFQGFQFSHPLDPQTLEGKLDNFRRPSGNLVAMGYARIDLSRLSDEHGGYELTPVLYKLLSRCMQVLFSAPDHNAAVETALAYIGQELGVSRSYVFLKGVDGLYSNTHEWCAPGIAPEKENLQNQDIEAISPEWIQALTQDGMLVASDIRMLNHETFGVLISQGIRAVVEFPIWKEGRLFGFVGFDDCEAIHYWTREEIQMLHTLTNIISATLGKIQLEGQVALQSEQMKNMLNHMDTFIYVSDLDNNEILFANTELQQAYGGQALVGRTCWEVLQGKDSRCSFCPVPQLLEHPGENFHWEFYNELLGAHLRISDCIIPWEGDRLVHFEYALNITELKQYQMRLEEYASLDTLTETLNRNAFLGSAKRILQQGFLGERPVTIAFIDIDGLKAENDLYGHSAGDALIRRVVTTLRANIRGTDLICRYGGDEFVILFYDCTKTNAERSLFNTLIQLKKEHRRDTGGSNYSFSFGTADTEELPYTSSSEYLEQLIHVADMRMIAFKRAKRIHRK